MTQTSHQLEISDVAIWFKHVHAPSLAKRLYGLQPEEEVTLATVFAGFRFVWNHKPAVALRYRWQGSATFARLDAFARGIHAGLERVLEHGLPMILVGDGDIGGLVGIHFREELNLANAIVSIDGITLKEFDFIDIGAMLELSGAVPVVIKSLVFPASAALGRAV